MHSKPLSLLLIVLISLTACQHKKPVASPAQPTRPRFNPDSAYRFSSLEPHEVLNRLFDSPLIHGDTAIWKPNFSETMLPFRLSYDDSCHTAIDTIIYFKDHDTTHCAVMVFATYRFTVDSLDGMKIEIGDCHSCGATVGMALFSQDTDRSWHIYAFNKALTVSGVSGGITDEGVGKFSLVQLGDRWTGLLLKEPVFASGGAEEAGAQLFAIEADNINGNAGNPPQALLSYMYHSSFEEPGASDTQENTTLEVVGEKKQPSIIRLVTITNGKRKIKYYRYMADDNKYVPAKPPINRSSKAR
jgi:hypothetical protein